MTISMGKWCPIGASNYNRNFKKMSNFICHKNISKIFQIPKVIIVESNDELQTDRQTGELGINDFSIPKFLT